MNSKDTEGGWMWWLTNARTTSTEKSVKELFALYIKGVKWEDV